MDEFEKYLKDVEKKYNEFVKWAKKIKSNDKSIENTANKSNAVKANLELRAILQKFRGSS